MVNALKILRSALEFLHSQATYDQFFLKQRIEFLTKDNEYLQSHFENLEKAIEEKSKEINEKNLVLDKFLVEKETLEKKIEELRENTKKRYEEQLQANNEKFRLEKEDLIQVILVLF